MKAILAAPVDLLWNGGIGTYVKAVDRDQRRRRRPGQRRDPGRRQRRCACKVVGEGGNLGLHPARPDRGRAGRRPGQHRRHRQLRRRRHLRPRGQHQDPARPRWSRDGDLTAEAAQRAAGVDDRRRRRTWCCATTTSRTSCSATPARRRTRCCRCTQRLIHCAGGARRPRPGAGVPARPTPRSTRRHDAGLGLTSPEFSVLVAYAKIDAQATTCWPRALPDDPWFAVDAAPTTSRGRCASGTATGSPATRCAARSSPTRWSTRWSTAAASRSPSGPTEETGATPEQVARAYRGLPRGLRPRRVRGRGRGARQRRCPPRAQTAALPGVPPAARPRDALVPADPRRPSLDVAAEVERFRRRSWPSSRPQHAEPAGRVPSAGACERRADGAGQGLGAPSELAPARPRCSTVLAARRRRDRGETGRDAERGRAGLLRAVRAVRRRRDADAGSPRCRATTAGTPWPVACAARRPVRRAGGAHHVGARTTSEPGQTAAERIAAVGEGQRRRAHPGPRPRSRGGRADRDHRASPRCRWRCAPCAAVIRSGSATT